MILYNGKLVDNPDFSENLFKQNLNIYEVIRILNGKPVFLRDNLERLSNSLKLSKIALNVHLEDLPNKIKHYISSCHITEGNLKYVLHFVGSKFDEYLFQIPHHYPTAKDYEEGVTTVSMHAMRSNPQVKYVNPTLREDADKLLAQSHAYEAILIADNGCITEGSRSNLFFFTKNEIITAPLADVLPGTTRKRVIDTCNMLNLSVKEERIPFAKVTDFDACCITGTSPLVLPIKKIDNVIFNPQNALLRALMKQYLCIINSDFK